MPGRTVSELLVVGGNSFFGVINFGKMFKAIVGTWENTSVNLLQEIYTNKHGQSTSNLTNHKKQTSTIIDNIHNYRSPPNTKFKHKTNAHPAPKAHSEKISSQDTPSKKPSIHLLFSPAPCSSGSGPRSRTNVHRTCWE